MVQASASAPSWILKFLYLFCPHDPVKGKGEEDGGMMDGWIDLARLGDALEELESVGDERESLIWKTLPISLPKQPDLR